MIFNHRILAKSNGVLMDATKALSGVGAKGGFGFDYVAATDYIYIGADVPFTSRYFKLDPATVNDVDATLESVEIWNNAWVPAVDVIDGTALQEKTMGQSGVIQWTTDRNEVWQRNATTENMVGSGLESVKIYDMYWARLKFSDDLKAGLTIDHVGYLFSDDDDLRMRYPDLLLPATLEAFATGKTDWLDQHLLAAEEIVRYLQRHHELWSPNQILNWQRYTQAAVHKCAEIAYNGFSGDDLEVLRARAEKNYRISLNQGNFDVDRNQDGHVQRNERSYLAGVSRG